LPVASARLLIAGERFGLTDKFSPPLREIDLSRRSDPACRAVGKILRHD
jgi:hypothetical protein